jgi:hypothetical protein
MWPDSDEVLDSGMENETCSLVEADVDTERLCVTWIEDACSLIEADAETEVEEAETELEAETDVDAETDADTEMDAVMWTEEESC